MNRADLLTAAAQAVSSRNAYGELGDCFTRIANRWNTHLRNIGHPGQLTPADVAMMLVDLKLARLEASPAHLDSWVDVAGYAACGAEVSGAE